jgi:EAL domain-containing protein (putative c-di-GMP-specific phosphodiesterase class I)
VDILQGWHFGRPMPAADLHARLAADNRTGQPSSPSPA